MARTRADYTSTFRDLAAIEGPADGRLADPEFIAWRARWSARRKHEGVSDDDARAIMRSVNPRVIPRNHRVEEAIAAAERNDRSVLTSLLEALERPFEDRAESPLFALPPPPGLGAYRAFCGT
ncbi:MAG: hypothetical protein FJ297_02310 [Planctomycetes bacterium]|nr:hypothetical protein [Planctomycetota bacterium]